MFHLLNSQHHPENQRESFTKNFYFFPPIAESRHGRGSPHHHLHAREGDRLLQALHEHGHQHPVPQTQRHQERLLLLPQSHDSRHLGLHPLGLLGRELRPVCHCQVRFTPSVPFIFFSLHFLALIKPFSPRLNQWDFPAARVAG